MLQSSPRKQAAFAALLALTLLATGCSGQGELNATKQDQAATEKEAAQSTAADNSTENTTENSEASSSQTTAFNKQMFSLDDPHSLWVVTNKQRPLNPLNHVPADLIMPQGVPNEFAQPLRADAARAVEQLYAAAQAAGIQLQISSAYRSYDVQVGLYQHWVNVNGAAQADRSSARPGHSEHQTGLAVDFSDYSECYLNACFGDTAAGKWLADNAAQFGFVLRYPEGAEGITGFMYEPWHFRYVGTELAAALQEAGNPTLEEFFGLPAAPEY